jgi:hypothetical protein
MARLGNRYTGSTESHGTDLGQSLFETKNSFLQTKLLIHLKPLPNDFEKHNGLPPTSPRWAKIWMYVYECFADIEALPPAGQRYIYVYTYLRLARGKVSGGTSIIHDTYLSQEMNRCE